MSGIDVREIKLELRYPDSRQEDVTDAFMRGYTGAIEVSNRAIEKLQAEIERLREQLEDMDFELDKWQTKALYFKQLADINMSENTQLRELVRDAWGNGHPDKSCGDCEIMDECHAEIEEAHKKGNGQWNTRCLFERRIEDRMRELGIEVDE